MRALLSLHQAALHTSRNRGLWRSWQLLGIPDSLALNTRHCHYASSSERHRIVFLGTPPGAADVLNALLDKSREPDSGFEVAAVVTRPLHGVDADNLSADARVRGRRKVSAVEALALAHGFPAEAILCPQSAKEVGDLVK
jgi:hypothetical protein